MKTWFIMYMRPDPIFYSHKQHQIRATVKLRSRMIICRCFISFYIDHISHEKVTQGDT